GCRHAQEYQIQSFLGWLRWDVQLKLYQKIVLSLFFSNQTKQVFTVFVFLQWLCEIVHIFSCDITHTVSNFFQVSNLKVLHTLHGFNVLGCFQKAFVCSCIKPSKATFHHFNRKVATFKVNFVNICDFKFATRTWFDVFSNLNHVIVIEIKTCDSIVRFRMFWFFLDCNSISVFIKFNHTQSFWIFYLVTKDSSTFFLAGCFLKHFAKSWSKVDVVNRDKSNIVITD